MTKSTPYLNHYAASLSTSHNDGPCQLKVVLRHNRDIEVGRALYISRTYKDLCPLTNNYATRQTSTSTWLHFFSNTAVSVR